MAEHQNAQGEMELKAREVDAKIALIAAQIEKIHADIAQGEAGLQIQAEQTSQAGRKTDAEIERGAAEVDIARQGVAITGKKTDADIQHKGAEIELGAHKMQTEAGLKARELAHAEEQGKVAAKKTDADIKHDGERVKLEGKKVDQGGEKVKIDGKRASTEAKVATGRDPDEKPKKSRFKVIRGKDGLIEALDREDIG
jgi:hypothetical protein